MSTAEAVHGGYRLRDLIAGFVVLMIGGAMTYTLYTNGSGTSVSLTYRAFILGALLLMIAYGTGMAIDRLGQRFPALVRPRRSPLPAVFVATVLTTGLAYVIVESGEKILALVW